MPQRAETVRGYVQGMHATGWPTWRGQPGRPRRRELATIETRFRYNPDVKSLVAMVPAVIPLLLMMIPAMLTALSVVREKELGSIVNLYVTPVTRLEFLLGKQLPYIALAMLNFLLLTALAVFVFGVPLKGSFAALAAGGAAVCDRRHRHRAGDLEPSCAARSPPCSAPPMLTILPAVQFSGMIDPVSSLEGAGALIGKIYPTTHFLTIARGTFSKALGFADLQVVLHAAAACRARADRPGSRLAAEETGALTMRPGQYSPSRESRNCAACCATR